MIAVIFISTNLDHFDNYIWLAIIKIHQEGAEISLEALLTLGSRLKK